MEDSTNRQYIKLFTNDTHCEKFISKPNFNSLNFFQPDLCVLIMCKSIVTWKKPTYFGATVLDLFKLIIHRFLYETLNSIIVDKAKLLYSDTDSLLLAIESENLYEDFQKFQDVFDFSDYPNDLPLHCDNN